jgi:hypothetical protein
LGTAAGCVRIVYSGWLRSSASVSFPYLICSSEGKLCLESWLFLERAVPSTKAPEGTECSRNQANKSAVRAVRLFTVRLRALSHAPTETKGGPRKRDLGSTSTVWWLDECSTIQTNRLFFVKRSSDVRAFARFWVVSRSENLLVSRFSQFRIPFAFFESLAWLLSVHVLTHHALPPQYRSICGLVGACYHRER